jgi:ribonuclease HI
LENGLRNSNEFTIDYVHRSSIQYLALADFIAD